MLVYFAMHAFDVDETGRERHPHIVRFIVWCAWLKHWAFGAISDASKVAWRGDSTSTEYHLALITMLVGVGWAFIPIAATSVFGAIDRAFPGVAAPLCGIIMAIVGRNGLCKLAYGTPRARMIAARWIGGVWLFLFLNQLFLNWATIGTIIFAYSVFRAWWIHEHITRWLERSAKARAKSDTTDDTQGKAEEENREQTVNNLLDCGPGPGAKEEAFNSDVERSLWEYSDDAR